MSSEIIIPNNQQPDNIRNLIYEIRGQKVMLDHDLADMYEVEVSQLKRQVRRNIDRFPQDFMFELTSEEVIALRCQNGILKNGGFATNPFPRNIFCHSRNIVYLWLRRSYFI